eukprot:SAG11_NODE_31160_length_294_cov_0.794872_1_plen_57_part_01
MDGNCGSLACELFDDVIEELEAELASYGLLIRTRIVEQPTLLVTTIVTIIAQAYVSC